MEPDRTNGEIAGEAASAEAELRSWVGRHLRRATNSVLQHLTREFEPYKIRVSLFAVLRMIELYPGSSGTELSGFLDVPRANMVLLLRELETRGLIMRGEKARNRRAHAFQLTEQGTQLMHKLNAAHERHEGYLEERMTAAERDFLIGILQRLWSD